MTGVWLESVFLFKVNILGYHFDMVRVPVSIRASQDKSDKVKAIF